MNTTDNQFLSEQISMQSTSGKQKARRKKGGKWQAGKE